MEPKIVTKPAFLVVGMPYVGKNENAEIQQMWGVFNGRMNEVKDVIHDHTAFGICNAPDDSGVFEYVAALPVTKVDELPQGMVARLVPEQEYAVFVHVGSVVKLNETYDYIMNGWLPKSGYEYPQDRFDFELYDEDFKFGEPDSKMYIYLPIAPKQ